MTLVPTYALATVQTTQIFGFDFKDFTGHRSMYKRGIFVSVKSTIGCLYKILEATTHVLMQNEVTH